MLENLMGPNAVWLAEALAGVMDLRPGMRVLDMGCGRAISSIFLAKEFGVQVWATDLWIKPSENWARIRAAGLESASSRSGPRRTPSPSPRRSSTPP
jgi:cyclopropane fatty-acyl-phospholipid synthase-like methyltransferase